MGWDRGFLNYHRISAFIRRGASLLARVKSDALLRPVRHLDDSSYPGKICQGEVDHRRDIRGLSVRVIERTLDDPNRLGASERRRPITHLNNSEDLTASEHRRPSRYDGRKRLAVDEIKTHRLARLTRS